MNSDVRQRRLTLFQRAHCGNVCARNVALDTNSPRTELAHAWCRLTRSDAALELHVTRLRSTATGFPALCDCLQNDKSHDAKNVSVRWRRCLKFDFAILQRVHPVTNMPDFITSGSPMLESQVIMHVTRSSRKRTSARCRAG